MSWPSLCLVYQLFYLLSGVCRYTWTGEDTFCKEFVYLFSNCRTRCNCTQFIWVCTLLYMFREVPPPTIRSMYNCIYSIWYWSNRYGYLPLWWISWNWSERVMWGALICLGGLQVTSTTCIALNLVFRGPCVVSIFWHISNKMQPYTVYLSLDTALCVSGGISTHHQEHIQLYLQHLALVKPYLLRQYIYILIYRV
jgi:hypothetical protein